MIPTPDLLLVGVAAFFAAALAAVVGFGGSAILLPLLVPMVGAREAVLVLTVVQLIGNASRVIFNRAQLVLPVVGWFALGAVPGAAIGGMLFAAVPLPVLTRALGLVLIAIVVGRHLRLRSLRPLHTREFAALGALASFGSAVAGTIGPLLLSFFLAYGLVKGALLGTEALATLVIQVVKLGAYAGANVLSDSSLLLGVTVSPLLIMGSYVGKRLVERLPERLFVLLVEAAMLVSGLTFLLRA